MLFTRHCRILTTVLFGVAGGGPGIGSKLHQTVRPTCGQYRASGLSDRTGVVSVLLMTVGLKAADSGSDPSKMDKGQMEVHPTASRRAANQKHHRSTDDTCKDFPDNQLPTVREGSDSELDVTSLVQQHAGAAVRSEHDLPEDDAMRSQINYHETEQLSTTCIDDTTDGQHTGSHPAMATYSVSGNELTSVYLPEGKTDDTNSKKLLASKSNAQSSSKSKEESGGETLPQDDKTTAPDNLSTDRGGMQSGTSQGADRENPGDIIVVTGGSGFLGQHIIKLIHERAPYVSEIWVYDIVPFEQKLDYQPSKKVKAIVGSITDLDLLVRTLNGATSVIHVAGLISWGTFPDVAGMEAVNVKGTQDVLNACLENNIQRLVHCSTVDVAIGMEPIRGGDETNTPVPEKFLFPGYPDTKHQGEIIVLGAAKCSRNDGEKLQTAILRANVCYGELDTSYVTNALKMARKNNRILQQIGDGQAKFQQAYAGNAAWAFVCADRAMKENGNLSNEVFYIPDNTPIQNSFHFMQPFLKANNLQLSTYFLSYPWVYWAVYILEKMVKGMSPLVRLNLPFQSHTIAYINTDFYFCGAKAKRMLGYEPLYTPTEARELSMKYYTSLDLGEEPNN